MNEQELRDRIHRDPAFVNAQRLDNDISKLEARYPDGCPDNVIAKALMITEDGLSAEYDRIVLKLRDLMGVEV